MPSLTPVASVQRVTIPSAHSGAAQGKPMLLGASEAPPAWVVRDVEAFPGTPEGTDEGQDTER